MTDTDDAARPATTNVDLNAARAARREARGTPKLTFTIGEDTYDLPDELPAEVIDSFGGLASGDFSGFAAGIRAIVGDAVYDELITKHRLSMDDVEELLTKVMDVYGVPFGSSSASPPS